MQPLPTVSQVIGKPPMFSHVLSQEAISPTQVVIKPGVVRIPVERNAPYRRIYLFVDTKSTGDFVFYGAVRCLLNGQTVMELPAGLCALTTLVPNQSIVNCFSAGGSAVGDSIVLQLAQPFTAGIPNVVLQPLRMTLDIDAIEFDILSAAGLLSGFRVWLGCISTSQ
jgi:hypothetical protein